MTSVPPRSLFRVPPMTNVNWFPGHMHKTLQSFPSLFRDLDLAISVVDARGPVSTSSTHLFSSNSPIPVLKVATKADLAVPNLLTAYSAKNHLVPVNTANRADAVKVLAEIEKKFDEKRRRIVVGVVGVPNVGKSSLIKSLKKIGPKSEGSGPKTGPLPGVTKYRIFDSYG
jgi:ribosome biogenesis GTPase A